LSRISAEVCGRNAPLACALERYYLAHGNYPAQLDDLLPRFAARLPTDAMSGKPLVYRRESAQAFVLYSLGKNLVDDGGAVALKKRGEVDLERGDVVWRQPGGAGPLQP
jgi:hypothetical protein